MTDFFTLASQVYRYTRRNRVRKGKDLEETESQLAASTTLVYMLDAKDFRNRSWLADTHTKKKRSGHKLQVSG